MKKSLFKKYISLFIALFIFVNGVFLSFFNDKKSINNYVKESSIEQILFAVNVPADILSKITQSNKNTQKKENKKDHKDSSCYYECLLPVGIMVSTIFNFSNSFSNSFSDSITERNIVREEYPIKIPFLQCIFILLILRLLFVVLPRSISVNYNIKYIEKEACIVL